MSSERPVAIVTGANRGIGRACAVALAGRGFDLAGIDLAKNDDTIETERAVVAAGGAVAFFVGDIADAARHAALVEEVMTKTGPIACLVNNAGVQTRERVDLLDLSPAEFDRVVSVNLRGTFFFTQAVARAMLAAPVRDGRSIVTITSSAAAAANPSAAPYCVSKTGLSMIVRLFALRLAEAGIAVHEVRPGIIRTAMTGPNLEPYERILATRVPLRRWGGPVDVGRAVAALASGDIGYTTGDVFNISGGFQIDQIA
jgi:NAD(P)-dependent dehydrogenase (short-subunit alcohol dehydrogenase family)